MPRSEENRIVGKETYTELNLTQYPDKIDTRSNNANMAGFENNKDYNYAEHINALADAVQALQRAIGAKPYMDKENISHTTVSNRITAIESKDYDTRYGGVGWNPTQTIVAHTHTGGAGSPGQINLVTEVKGKLTAVNINLDGTDPKGLTASAISVSTTDIRKIPEVLNDKLSISAGGTIRGAVNIEGVFSTRTHREYNHTNRSAGDLVVDYGTSSNTAMISSSTELCQFYNTAVQGLAYGRYAMAVRMKINQATTEDVMVLRWYDWMTGGWRLSNQESFKGTDFVPNTWKTIYLTFEHQGDLVDSYSSFHVWKPFTSSSVRVSIDHVVIMPIHPATFDR